MVWYGELVQGADVIFDQAGGYLYDVSALRLFASIRIRPSNAGNMTQRCTDPGCLYGQNKSECRPRRAVRTHRTAVFRKCGLCPAARGIAAASGPANLFGKPDGGLWKCCPNQQHRSLVRDKVNYVTKNAKANADVVQHVLCKTLTLSHAQIYTFLTLLLRD